MWTTAAAPVDVPDVRGPVAQTSALHRAVPTFADDTTTRRKAVSLSDWYVRRLAVHRYASYAMIPLFVGEFILGQQLLSQKDGVYDGTRRVPIDADLRRNHRVVAMGLGTVFATNTVTGLWNLWEARNDGSVSKRRTLHVLSMLTADAGFATAGVIGQRAVKHRPSDARAHRNVALASMGVAIGSVSLMWF
jgi:hypothetical protein